MKRLLTSLTLVACIIGLTGCANLSPQGKARIEASAEIAAYVGTTEFLKAKPQSRIGFEVAARELKVLEDGPIDAAKLLEIINRLPVKELKSDRAQMIISATSIVLISEVGATPIEKLDNLRPVIAAIRRGVERGLQ